MAAASLASQAEFTLTVSTAWATDLSEPGIGCSRKNFSTMAAFSSDRKRSDTALVRKQSRNPDGYLIIIDTYYIYRKPRLVP
jgi:hypothetical protein